MSEFCIEQFSILWQVDKNKRIYKQPKLWPRKFTCKRPLTQRTEFFFGNLCWACAPGFSIVLMEALEAVA